MYSLWLECGTEGRDELVAELFELGTLGITEHPAALQAFFEERFDVTGLAAWKPRWEEEAAQDWVAVSRKGWEPAAVGERLFLVPDWRDDAAPAGRVRLTVHAGMASGSGYSDPTQLALEALEKHLRGGETVLDVGTGSGILTAAAALLGAGKLLACEIEAEAAGQAARNFLAAGVSVQLFVGSPRSLAGGVADLVAANLNAMSILGSAGELRRVLAPGGRLILSGFRERRMEEVRKAFPDCEVVRETGRLYWRCLVLGLISGSRK
ncbi:MAG: 50S ribosomal protein L11 methyltransferase [Acidobacteriia bacterium]|nr:50S ribosomal protein L11 methyltransferase [Terriglobia bacterium]